MRDSSIIKIQELPPLIQQIAEEGEDFEEEGVFAAAGELVADEHGAVVAVGGGE